MTPDFTPYLMSGEQIMWQGESHKEGPAADLRNTRGTRLFAVIWIIITSMIFIPVIFLTKDLKGAGLASMIGMTVVFIGIGVGLLIYSFHYKQEYYCLTDRRFLSMNASFQIRNRDLYHVKTAQITGISNGYGSILMTTDIVHHSRTNGHYHTYHETWSIRGVQDVSECYRILTSILMINEDNGI